MQTRVGGGRTRARGPRPALPSFPPSPWPPPVMPPLVMHGLAPSAPPPAGLVQQNHPFLSRMPGQPNQAGCLPAHPPPPPPTAPCPQLQRTPALMLPPPLLQPQSLPIPPSPKSRRCGCCCCLQVRLRVGIRSLNHPALVSLTSLYFQPLTGQQQQQQGERGRCLGMQ